MSARKRSSPRRKRKRGFLACWWTLLLGLLLAPLAVRAASVLALSGPSSLRLLFPFAALVQNHFPAALAPDQREALAAWAMWAQFPVYGLLASLIACAARVSRGLAAVFLLHAAAVAAALLTAPA